ncbi:hypothetical protein C8A01DRAFT_39472 [Parachaetomium inaequale]|uniref:Uncharacterized protein n=1 Tax=Parachaetomium inaequale TaxID=2588326 RepID=A0AAN6PC37_9PEZI|nr:hypothetical protein C8A01DRAFT_39472 [Parachaetomium inaequale]
MPQTSMAKNAAGEGANPGELTRDNLQQFTAAERRERAHRRGRSTPSPEPDFHTYQSEDSYVSPPRGGDKSGSGQEETPCRDHVSDQQPADVPATSEASLADQYTDKPVEDWGDPPFETSSAHNDPDITNPSHSGGLEEAMPNPGHQPAHRSILYHRPNIPRHPPPQQAPPEHESPTTSANPAPHFPPNFPAYHCTQNMNEIAAYLANASYVAALGGPPLADLKYGIIVVPVGEESLLFGRPPDFVASHEFLDAVDDANRDYDRALRMHDPGEDSEEFKRGRFEDGFGSVSVGAHRNVEVGPGREGKGEGEGGGGEVP